FQRMEGEGATQLTLRPIVGLFRNDPAHSTTRVKQVAFVPRYQMNVEVRHSLARGGPIVNPDVETVRVEFSRYRSLCSIEQGQQRVAFSSRGLKEGAHVTLWNDEAVA